MHIAALPVGFGQHFDDGPLEPRMIVADGEDYSTQAASLEAKKELFPACGTLPVGPSPRRAPEVGHPHQCRWPQAPLASESLRSPALSHTARRGSDRDTHSRVVDG